MSEFKLSELGEAAFLAWQRARARRHDRAVRKTKDPAFLASRKAYSFKEWDDLSGAERAAWSAAAKAVSRLVDPSASDDASEAEALPEAPEAS